MTSSKIPRNFYNMVGAALSLSTAFQMILPILPLYIMEKGATTFDLGLIISMASLTSIVSRVPLGMLMETRGKSRIIPITLIGESLVLVMYALVTIPAMFYPIRIVQALLLAVFNPTMVALASDLAPLGKRGDVIGRYLTSYGLATMLGPLICAFLITYLTKMSIFLIASLLPLMGFFIIASSINYLRKIDSDLKVKSVKSEKTGVLSILKETLNSRNVILLCSVRFLFSFANAFLITIFAIYLVESLNLASSIVALLFTVKGFTNMAFRVPVGKLSDKIGRRKPMITAYLLLTFIWLLISEVTDIFLLILLMALYGMSHAMRAVSEWALLGDTFYSGMSGVSAAVLSTMFDLGQGLGAIFCGSALYLFSLSPTTIFKLGAIITSVAFTALLIVKPKYKGKPL